MKTGLDNILAGSRLFGPEMHEDPYPVYHELRERDPVHWDDALHAWVLTRYEEVSWALTAVSSDRVTQARKRLQDEALQPLFDVLARLMAQRDEPDHTRVRSLVQKAFLRTSVERWSDSIQRRVRSLLEAGLRLDRWILCGILRCRSPSWSSRRSSVSPPTIGSASSSGATILRSWPPTFTRISPRSSWSEGDTAPWHFVRTSPPRSTNCTGLPGRPAQFPRACRGRRPPLDARRTPGQRVTPADRRQRDHHQPAGQRPRRAAPTSRPTATASGRPHLGSHGRRGVPAVR